MLDMSKPWVMREGNTIIGYDPGDPRGDLACQVTMEYDPRSGVYTVTDIQQRPYRKPEGPGVTNGLQTPAD
jgi:hypothetical protein